MANPRTLDVQQAFTASCRAKIARADEHLDALYRETDGWGDGDPFTIERESNADGSEHLFRLRVKVEPDVPRWGILLGDALFDLRCALDHMVYAIAVSQTRQDPPPGHKALMFPICSDSDYFAGADRKIACLNDTTKAAIERTQPYNRLNPDQWFAPLWWLSQLNDIDKHRFSHLSAVGAVPDDIAIDAEPGTFRAHWNNGILVDGTPVLRLVLSKPDPDVYVDLKASGAVVLKFKGLPTVGLHHVARHVRREVVVVCRYLSRCIA